MARGLACETLTIMKKEERERVRLKVEKVKVKHIPKGKLALLEKFRGNRFQLLDIGTGGLQFKATRIFKPGRTIMLLIELPGMQPFLEIEGLVRWCKENPVRSRKHLSYCVGVQFGSIGTTKAKALLSDLGRDG